MENRPKDDPDRNLPNWESGLEAALAGYDFSSSQAKQLEREIKRNPDDLLLRMAALGYYSANRFSDLSSWDASCPHILWLIEHHPASEEAGQPCALVHQRLSPSLFAAAQSVWERQIAIHQDQAEVLGNASRFLQSADPAAAEKLLIKACDLEPENARWPERLGNFYDLQAKEFSVQFPDAAAKALAAYREASGQLEGVAKFYLLTRLPMAAYRAGENAAAQDYAWEVLAAAPGFPDDWNYGNAIYHANSALGLVALREDDIAGANRHLLAAGATPGSPQLDSFGPDLTLANLLLKEGQGPTVIEFLSRIATFWEGYRPALEKWQVAIRLGEKPDLGKAAAQGWGR